MEPSMNITNSSTNPKRVAGGIVLGGKKKKKKRKVVAAAVGASSSSSNNNNRSVPSILKSVPPIIANHSEDVSSPPPHAAAAAAANSNDDEFGDFLLSNDDELPSDVLLCLQSYTQSSLGMTAEACAYCPIFANNNNNNHDGQVQSSNNKKVCTHLAPFLPQTILLHILDDNDNTSRMQTEQDIKSLASKNQIRLLQLHGTAITATAATTSSSFRNSKLASAKFSNNGVTELRGDGNDDDDIAVMEILAYETAVKMAIQSHTSTLSNEEQKKSSFDADAICNWFLQQLVPYYAGKTWISSSNLNSFVESYRVKDYWSVDRMTKVIHELTCAGLFLPRRGLGAAGSRMEGYWFSLPGLGSTSKSIADGRVAMLRKLRSCRYQEKKRSILEREYGQFKDGSDDVLVGSSSWGVSKKKRACIQQSGRFLVLDLLAKGLVDLKKTSSGEHFISLPK